jgi:hypothetical protein
MAGGFSIGQDQQPNAHVEAAANRFVTFVNAKWLDPVKLVQHIASPTPLSRLY